MYRFKITVMDSNGCTYTSAVFESEGGSLGKAQNDFVREMGISFFLLFSNHAVRTSEVVSFEIIEVADAED